ncbi:DUF354 domain-containing protein [Candidatus Sumerlaeota bacterium]|nr:DUF354 domain-containing protein [Candidatus Sumerlaeota bacterium]
MNVWIDLANSPHVGFFLPLMREMKRDGHTIFVTLRDFSQTVELARQNNIDGLLIGKHGGRSRTGKVLNLIGRSMDLKRFARGKKIDVAVSHNSYTHIVAGRLAGCRTVTLMDYEGQPANHLAFRAAHKVIVPESFPDAALRKFGASPRRIYKYAGFKEQVYLSDFAPDPAFPDALREACGLGPEWDPDKAVVVTVRTPATMAAYHRFENPLFDRLIERLDSMPELTVVTLPRTAEQRESIQARYRNLRIPSRALDGNNLVHASDLVVSAGGTMNREAAILGTPAYTIFAGKIPAVDERLIGLGKMTALLEEGDLDKIRLEKKRPGGIMENKNLCREIVREILS